jgi:hypothetical protein
MAKETNVETEKLPKGSSIPIGEVGRGMPIEVMSEQDVVKFKEVAELEKFMNEILTIVVHPDISDGALPVICPNVNGINQPIIRGKQVNVKRKYVEVLARTRTTRYEQATPDARKPENIQMTENAAISYPFAVVHDPNPRGRDWLEAIIAQK